jgi:hypothetical protein
VPTLEVGEICEETPDRSKCDDNERWIVNSYNEFGISVRIGTVFGQLNISALFRDFSSIFTNV